MTEILYMICMVIFIITTLAILIDFILDVFSLRKIKKDTIDFDEYIERTDFSKRRKQDGRSN